MRLRPHSRLSKVVIWLVAQCVLISRRSAAATILHVVDLVVVAVGAAVDLGVTVETVAVAADSAVVGSTIVVVDAVLLAVAVVAPPIVAVLATSPARK